MRAVMGGSLKIKVAFVKGSRKPFESCVAIVRSGALRSGGGQVRGAARAGTGKTPAQRELETLCVLKMRQPSPDASAVLSLSLSLVLQNFTIRTQARCASGGRATPDEFERILGACADAAEAIFCDGERAAVRCETLTAGIEARGLVAAARKARPARPRLAYTTQTSRSPRLAVPKKVCRTLSIHHFEQDAIHHASGSRGRARAATGRVQPQAAIWSIQSCQFETGFETVETGFFGRFGSVF